MDSAYLIRPPVADDIDALAKLHVLTWQQTYSDIVPASALGPAAIAVRQRLWSYLIVELGPQPGLLVAEYDRQLVGFISAGESTAEGAVRPEQLMALYLEKSHHGSGLAQQLLDAVLGRRPAELWVAAKNPRAMSFYRRNGFVPDGATNSQDSHANLDEIRMVR
ncbi:MAG: GNAT family N-acetyltransferase [Antricoccus sp.]